MLSVLLGVSGSVACYKAAELTRLLRRRGAPVQVAMTPTATRFVGAPTFRALSGCAVLADEWQSPQTTDGMDHIAAARQADIVLVAPASANFIAQAAAGMSNNVLLAVFLAATGRRILAPAMNQHMWQAAATRRNIACLQADGVQILGPESGEQACGDVGPGRMLEVADIVHRLFESPWRDKRVVVSTGATVEHLDSMRVISNRSSGQMGFAIAAAAADLGANTAVIAGQTTAPPPPSITLRRAVQGEEMRRIVLEETATADWFFSVAAVADFRPVSAIEGKPERQNGKISLMLSPTEDILAEVRRQHPRVNCVGFAAQTGDEKAQVTAARDKMTRKSLHWLALNDINDADRQDCQLTLLHASGKQDLPRLPKAEAARRLLDAILEVSRETSQ